MALSFSMKLVLPQPQIPANTTRTVKQRRIAAPPAQELKFYKVSRKTIQQLPQLVHPSRREAILCLMTSLAADALFPTQPAEAQVVNLDITQTIIEKVQEFLGLSKPKTESGTSDKEKNLPENQNDQSVNMLEMMKEKAGISKPNSASETNGSEVEKQPQQPAAQSNAPLDVVEKHKEMAGGSKRKIDSVSSSGEMKLPVNQNDLPKDALKENSSSNGEGKRL